MFSRSWRSKWFNKFSWECFRMSSFERSPYTVRSIICWIKEIPFVLKGWFKYFSLSPSLGHGCRANLLSRVSPFWSSSQEWLYATICRWLKNVESSIFTIISQEFLIWLDTPSVSIETVLFVSLDIVLIPLFSIRKHTLLVWIWALELKILPRFPISVSI